MNLIIVFLNTIWLFNIVTSSVKISLVKPPSIISSKIFYKKLQNPYGKKYYEELMKEKEKENYKYARIHNRGLKKYPISQVYYEQQLSRLNSNNNTIRDNELLSDYLQGINAENEEYYNYSNITYQQQSLPQLRIRINKQNIFDAFGIQLNFNQDDEEHDDNPYMQQSRNKNNKNSKKDKKSKSDNFEVVDTYNLKFKDVGGYNNVKEELKQCVDLLKNFTKYSKYNVRVPKGLILEGPPGTGKTLLSKALAGEAGCGFIAVAGSDFQEKYVGVGSTRIKELFKLANDNKPCIIFIDEIDALGRKRSSDGETSSSERDATLNALLVELDGFKNNTGIFLVSATNRIDLLDAALTRPGRIDKKIFIGLPDKETRNAILNIHIKGKPHDNSIKKYELVEMTEGLTGAQIENLLNEAMLNALRSNREMFTIKDFDLVFNKMIVGWQPNEHKFTTDIIDHIAIHEMGHAIVGILSKHHSKMTKVVINFSSPRSPGYTVFETSTSNIYTRESLFEHLMILLAGRIAEEIFYGTSVTTGALNDFEEALKLSEKMVIYYGMGTNVIYPSSSDKYKEMIDNDVIELINKAYEYAETILKKSTSLIKETSDILKKDKFLTSDNLVNLINKKYPELNDLKIEFADTDTEE
jgi:cell division protease FtsH